MATHIETHREGDYPPHMRSGTLADEAGIVLLNRISWGAVFAGVAMALVIQLILNMIGVGIGAATIDPATAETPSLFSLSLGAAIWWTVSGIIAAFAGGFTAGRLAGKPRESTAGWHGLTSWAFSTLVVFYLLTAGLTTLVGGTVNTVTNVAGGTLQAAGGAVQTTLEAGAPVAVRNEEAMTAIESEIRTAVNSPEAQAIADAAVAAMRALLTGDSGQAAQAREEAAQAIAEIRDIPVSEARVQVRQYEARYTQAAGQAQERAVEVADTAADTVSRSALIGALALILGAIAAWFGGRAGISYLSGADYRTLRREEAMH